MSTMPSTVSRCLRSLATTGSATDDSEAEWYETVVVQLTEMEIYRLRQASSIAVRICEDVMEVPEEALAMLGGEVPVG